nr:FAD:protein FMN transferase [uncultured Oscillibacter sp.]
MSWYRHGFPLILILALCTGCGQQSTSSDPTERAVFAMDTYITMQAYGSEAEPALEEAEHLIRRLESRFSVTDESSEIYTANHSGGEPVIISNDTALLIDFALSMAHQTNGALEPTIYPVLTAWGFTTDEYHIPAQDELDNLLPLVNCRNIDLTDTMVTVPDGMQLDLGAVAKGYTGDKVAELLRDRGVTSALINLGGNVQAVGSKPDGSPWRVGVRDPFTDGNLGVLEIKDTAVVTSGGYERYFTDEDGNVYWHILNPETGCPARSGLVSVTVVAPEGKLCDALSTALFVMGPEEAVQFWRDRQDFEMLLVDETGGIYLTEGLESTFSRSANAEDMEVTVIRHEAK